MSEATRTDQCNLTEMSFPVSVGLVVSATRGQSSLERGKTMLYCYLSVESGSHPSLKAGSRGQTELNAAPEAKTLSIMKLSPIAEGQRRGCGSLTIEICGTITSK